MRGRVIWVLVVLLTVTDSNHPRSPPISVRPGKGRGGATDKGTGRTFWEQTTVAVNQVFSQEPPIAEFVVPLNQFDAVTLCQGQLIGASGSEVICKWCASDKLAHGN